MLSFILLFHVEHVFLLKRVHCVFAIAIRSLLKIEKKSLLLLKNFIYKLGEMCEFQEQMLLSKV